jgi:hypothetical protein
LTNALARLATGHREMLEAVKQAFQDERFQSPLAPAIVRLTVAEVRPENESYSMQQHTATAALVQAHLALLLPNATACLTSILEAGTDDDMWNDNYHGVLAIAVQKHLEQHPELIPTLLARLEQALELQDWPSRRIMLAAVAAYIEEHPAKLEAMLVRGTTDAGSFNSRRHALTALSYLRTVTPAIVPALLAGCQDIDIVQRDAFAAAGRFQEVEGDVLSELEPWLTGESTKTAYAVTQVLSSLGTSTAGAVAGRREQIVTMLVKALQHPQCRREVVIGGTNKGTLEDALYTAVLKVSDWVG